MSTCPFNSTVPLAYRADCGDTGVNTVILSSTQPVLTEVYCNTFLDSSNFFSIVTEKFEKN
jgi:hypothetical protein